MLLALLVGVVESLRARSIVLKVRADIAPREQAVLT
jgi:hypothetical protein